MVAVADKVAGIFARPQVADPADADGVDDDTAAGKRHVSSGVAPELLPTKGRLRMRAGIPELQAYKGRSVKRKDVFGDDGDADATIVSKKRKPAAKEVSEASEAEDLSNLSELEDGGLEDGEDGEDAAEASGALRGFTISGKMEKEYARLMNQTQKELEVMRTPSVAEVVSRKAEAEQLKFQLEAWKALVEFRIHLESILAVGHRLPSGDASVAFREANTSVASKSEAVSKDLQQVLSTMLVLQQRMAEQSGVEVGGDEGGATQEASVWSGVDARMESVLEWGMGVADEWKERTRLDSRRSFKVLDQPLRAQMQAVAEVPAEKLRKRCTPPPGKHQVFGSARRPAAGVDDAGDDAEAVAEASNIFDDRDFYVQLLREVLASGGSSSGMEADQARDLAEVRGRRATKKKAKAEVERRASKGRKIRYVPIEKLQNFMSGRPRCLAGEDAPEPLVAHAVEALLRSLYGGAS